MLRENSSLVIVYFLLCLIASGSSLKYVKYLKTIDGDTFTVILSNEPEPFHKMSVRLYGIDAPEMSGHHPCEKDAARTAKKLLRHILNRATKIELIDPKGDKYFRILSHVHADGVDISNMMLAHHLAVPYFGGHKQDIDWCKEMKK